MVYQQYRERILAHLTALTGQQVQILAWMALTAPYKDGKMKIDRKLMAKELKTTVNNCNYQLYHLRKSGLIEKIPQSSWYLVRLRFPRGRYMIEVPKKPGLKVDDEL